MASVATAPAARGRRRFGLGGVFALRGAVAAYLGLAVALPLAALAWSGAGHGPVAFWNAVSSPQNVAALELTVAISVALVAVTAVLGTVVAWVLVRDDFAARPVLDAVVDLPFALPTIVSGLLLVTLYGPRSPLGLNAAYSRAGIVLALAFVTLPFVVRSVQPVLLELDREQEEAARSLGASPAATFRRVILPALRPAILGGAGLALARALGEFGSIVLLAGNIPFHTEVASVRVFGLIESDDPHGAAALSLVLLAVSLLAQVILGWLAARSARHAD